MARLIASLIAGLAGAVAVHLAVVLLVPALFAGRTHQALATFASATNEPAIFDAAAAADAGFTGVDPFFISRVCVFDLVEGPFRVEAGANPVFYALTISDTRDRVAFSLVDRLAFNGRINLEVLPRSAERRYRLRTDSGIAEPDSSVPVFVDDPRGAVIIKAFLPDPTFAPGVRRFLEEVRCEAIPEAG
jgi:uncharacterized membrane protein